MFLKKSTIPYILLTILHIGLFIFIAKKKIKDKPVPTLFASIGLSYIFEYFVLNIFKAYQYKPKLFKNKLIDSIFGAIVSQSILVPIAASIIALLQLGWAWMVAITLFYVAIEAYFLRAKIFFHNWWRTIYTGMLLPVLFFITKKWNKHLNEGSTEKRRRITTATLFLIYWVNFTNMHFILVGAFKKYLYLVGILKNRYREHFIILPIYTCIQSVIATVFTRWNKVYFGVLVLHQLDALTYKLKIIKTKTWSVYYFIPFHFLQFLIGKKMEERMK